MSFVPSGAINGAAINGFTSPTYTFTADVAPMPNGKAFYVSQLGGTQPGVDAHSISKPFTALFLKPVNLKQQPTVNPNTGKAGKAGVNVYKLHTHRGALPIANGSPDKIRLLTQFEIPAGVEITEPEEIKAALSAHIGLLVNQLNGLYDTFVTGSM